MSTPSRIVTQLRGVTEFGLAVSSVRKQFAVVLGVECRDRRRIDCRMVEVCLHSGVPIPLQMEEFFDQANGTRCRHRQDAGGIGRAIRETVAAASWDKNKRPGRADVFNPVQREHDRAVEDVDRLVVRPVQMWSWPRPQGRDDTLKDSKIRAGPVFDLDADPGAKRPAIPRGTTYPDITYLLARLDHISL